CWAPADLVFLDMRPGAVPRFGPTISTGWAAHADPAAAARAGVLEAIERDARIARANLRWRWYRIVTPYSPHVVLATVDGEDREGYVFAIGSACRLDRAAAVDKATLEAVQGRHY